MKNAIQRRSYSILNKQVDVYSPSNVLSVLFERLQFGERIFDKSNPIFSDEDYIRHWEDVSRAYISPSHSRFKYLSILHNVTTKNTRVYTDHKAVSYVWDVILQHDEKMIAFLVVQSC